MVGAAAEQFIQVAANGADGLAGSSGKLGAMGDTALLGGFEGLLERFGQPCDTLEADDGQGAACLMQVSARRFQRRRAVTFIARQRLERPVQRQVDFALDPGQGADVGRGRHAHRVVLRP